jgi:hypothetical protein
MLSFLESFKHQPSLKNLSLKRYQFFYSLDKLALGVDNIHFDVHISPQVCNTLKRTVYLLMIKHSESEDFFNDYKRESCEIEKETLRRFCTEVLTDGINRAKSANEVQIDFLCQTALAKLFLKEIKDQYKNLIAHCEPLLRMHQLSRHNQDQIFIIKDKLADIKMHRNQIIRLVGEELFGLLNDIQVKKLRNLRETHFRPEDILPDNYFVNPLLHTDNSADDFFLIEEYVLFGQRSKDPDNFTNVKLTINELLGKTDLRQENTDNDPFAEVRKNKYQKDNFLPDTNQNVFDPWIMEPSNIDRLFNYFDSQELYKNLKKAKESKDTLQKIKEQIKNQRKLLNLFYRKFKKHNLLKQIIASFEMKEVYGDYCPPMQPRQIREFLVDFWSRIYITHQQKRLRSVYGEAFSLAPLKQTIKRINSRSTAEKKQHLIAFLNKFSQYNRDLYNSRILRDGMSSINLVTEENIILLSRENRSLYEFLLSVERVKEEMPIISHIIIKADIRGSMEINNIMIRKKLNPASYFSLNFFDPISAILSEYDASKVFIEGDAIILSIFENENTQQSSYSVARACGLAIKILQIVRSYNEKNKENNLPILELGIGICYNDGPPTFLFDGDSRIMISSAINLADRLSSCDKKIRKRLKNQNPLFNLFEFKNAMEEETADSAEDTSLRYNVNGIELSVDGFNKLVKEINLKKIIYKAGSGENVNLYTGKVPTVSGNYQQIAVREATVYAIKPETMEVTGETSKKYYEVCASHEIYDFINNLSVTK